VKPPKEPKPLPKPKLAPLPEVKADTSARPKPVRVTVRKLK